MNNVNVVTYNPDALHMMMAQLVNEETTDDTRSALMIAMKDYIMIGVQESIPFDYNGLIIEAIKRSPLSLKFKRQLIKMKKQIIQEDYHFILLSLRTFTAESLFAI